MLELISFPALCPTMLIKPTYNIDGDITDIDILRISSDGIKGLIMDLDSTIMAPHSGSITQSTGQWLDQARQNFQLIVLSNNKKEEYLENARAVLDMEVIGHAKKPFSSGFKQALEVLSLPREEVAVVGDRALTDILGGNLSEIKTILVRPLKSIREPRLKTFVRNVERCLIKP